ncbi:MAG: hypothetical protein ABIT96_06040 [Ferruginibacter sp.]
MPQFSCFNAGKRHAFVIKWISYNYATSLIKKTIPLSPGTSIDFSKLFSSFIQDFSSFFLMEYFAV